MSAKTDRLFRQLQQELRLKAELQLADSEIVATPFASSSIDKLLHELQVYQIELEMQNEELQRALDGLEESQNRYRDLYDSAPVGYLTVNDNARIEECNLTFAEQLGLDRRQIVNRQLAKFIADQDKDTWHRLFYQIKKSGEKAICELSFQRMDGTSLISSLECRPVDEEGKPWVMRIIQIDISRRKMAENGLRIAAAAFESKEGIIVTDNHKVILRANKAFCHLMGYNRDEIIGRTPSFLRSGLQDSEFYEALWESLICRGYWEGEIWDKRKNGEVIPLYLKITRVSQDDGTLSHYVGFFSDITLQKQGEENQKKQHRELKHEMECTLEELEKAKDYISGAGAAVDFLQKQHHKALDEIRSRFYQEAENTILPTLDKLENSMKGHPLQLQLLSLIHSHMHHLMETYGKSSGLSELYKKLSPAEVQVVSMLKQGWPTKKIAENLHITTGTVNLHRKHIRAKLGLRGNKIILTGFLRSLSKGEP